MKNRVVITTNQILWTIILLNTSSDDWYIDYINDKLNYQIKLNDLEENINILILDKIEDIQDSENLGEYLNIINNGDISDNYIKTIYNNLEKTKKNCLCFSGIYKSKDGDYVFNQKEENSEEIFIPINKMNPIKKEFILKKFNNYIEGEFKKISAKFIDDILVYIDSDIDLNKTTNQETKEPFSIILTAYKTEKFIEECLDSIESQTYFENNDNYEILVGVDGCENTLNKLNEIKDKYRNLYIYMMKENRGTYMTTNALLNLIKYENVIRFDTDDIMEPNLVEDLVDFKNINDDDVIKLGYSDWREGKKINDYVLVNDGIIYFKKSVMDDIAGGYMPWECAADSELISRLKGRVKISGLNKRLFIRRIHDNSLTLRKDTGYKSVKRLKYNNQIKGKYNDDDVKIERVSSIVREDYVQEKNKVNNIEECKPISIIITAYQTQEFIEECLDSIENQTYFKGNNSFEVLVGVDACQITLDKLLQIRHKYRNLRIFMMSDNKGTWVTTNTLLNIVKYNNIIRFDADDIMGDDMLSTIMTHSNDYDIIQFKYHNFNNSIKNIQKHKSINPANGAIFFKRKILERLGGFLALKCAADFDFLRRAEKCASIKIIDKRVFFRRVHDKQLTIQNLDYSKRIGLEFKNKIYNDSEIKVNKIINTYIEIFEKIKMFDIIIPHTSLDKERDINLFYVIKYYKKYLPYSNIIIVEQNTETDIKEIEHLVSKHLKIKLDEKLFCKSFLLNEGYRKGGSKYILFADTDCIVDKNVLINIEKLLPDLESQVILPYNKPVINLTQSQTNTYMFNETIDDKNLERRNFQSNGGVVMISSYNYFKIGGHDPRFIGWGGEDDSFYMKAKNLLGVKRLDNDLVHLYHPKGIHNASNNPNYNKNYNFYKEYIILDNKKIIEKIGFEHLTKNTIDIVIGHKKDTKEREENLLFTIKYYKEHFPQSRIILSEIDTVTNLGNIKNYVDEHIITQGNCKYYSRSLAMNEGFKKTTSKYVMFVDNDIILDKQFFEELEQNYKILENNVIIPYEHSVIDLTEKQREDLIYHGNDFTEIGDLKYRIVKSVGGIALIKSQYFREMGGFDPRFIGYGGEDNVFFIKCQMLYGVVRPKYNVYHLYHHRDLFGTDTSEELYQNNVKLVRQYEKYDKNQLLEKIKEIGNKHLL